MNDLELRLVDLGAIRRVLRSKREVWAYQREWRKAFAPSCDEWSGALRDTDWHVFSHGLAGALHGAEAIAAFEASDRSQLCICEALGGPPVLECDGTGSLAFADWKRACEGDLYLAAADLAWAFVITHEDEVGPFFARRADVQD
ncbi:MAG: DUF4275 family protein [Polyangiales bacterium]